MSGHVKLEQLKSGHVKIFLDPKFILPWKSLEPNCLAPTFLWTYTFKTKIILGLTFFFSIIFWTHLFGPKLFGAKIFWSQIVLQRIFFFTQSLKTKKFLDLHFLAQLSFGSLFFDQIFHLVSFLFWTEIFFCDPTFLNTVFDTTQTKMHLSIVLWLLRGPTCFIWFCKLSFYRGLDILHEFQNQPLKFESDQTCYALKLSFLEKFLLWQLSTPKLFGCNF